MYINPKTLSNQSNPAPGLILLTDEQESTYTKYNGFVTLTSYEEEYEEGFFRTVYELTPNTEAWESWKASQPDPSETLAAEVRSTRDGLLRDSDWTQMLDSPLSEESKTAWQTYRQALRDVPQQEGFPENVTWPDAPA